MELDLFLKFIRESVEKINSDIRMLYFYKGNNESTLDHLYREAIILENYIEQFNQPNKLKDQVVAQQAAPAVNGTNVFTKEELAKFNGKNGNPAYVAINGVLYDVTNNAAWAAATHFGLSAGKVVTTAFASCHAGSDILNRLPIVGNLI